MGRGVAPFAAWSRPAALLELSWSFLGAFLENVLEVFWSFRSPRKSYFFLRKTYISSQNGGLGKSPISSHNDGLENLTATSTNKDQIVLKHPRREGLLSKTTKTIVTSNEIFLQLYNALLLHHPIFLFQSIIQGIRLLPKGALLICCCSG